MNNNIYWCWKLQCQTENRKREQTTSTCQESISRERNQEKAKKDSRENGSNDTPSLLSSSLIEV